MKKIYLEQLETLGVQKTAVWIKTTNYLNEPYCRNDSC